MPACSCLPAAVACSCVLMKASVLVLAGRGSCVLACVLACSVLACVLACLPVEVAEKKVQQTPLGGETTPMGCVAKPGLVETTP